MYISNTQTYYIHSLASASTNFSIAAEGFGNIASVAEEEAKDCLFGRTDALLAGFPTVLWNLVDQYR